MNEDGHWCVVQHENKTNQFCALFFRIDAPYRTSPPVSIATNAFRIIIDRMVYCPAFGRHAFHANAIRMGRLVCVRQLVGRVRAERALSDRSVINVPAASVA